ncbi:cytochrome c3 family protein [Aggregatilinea lenta]|uniref:cytochrome c3 family protein n=1 Tax=Aggregatilinea lenta TaxID=913108 RepID=UPI000E5B7269|nr:cytochrome c3 family protein [Aggregatilinea lenta]
MIDRLDMESGMGARAPRSLRRLMLIGGVLALALLALALVTSPAAAQGDDDGSAPTEEAPQPAEDDGNSYCIVCHGTPGRAVTLPDGSVLDLYVDPNLLAHSIHGEGEGAPNLGCTDCHGEDAFPHDDPLPDSRRVLTITAAESCSNCHNELLADSAHLEALAAGNLQAATCVDCHGSHEIQRTEDQPQLVAQVCGDCHTQTFQEWSDSPHVDMGSLGCAVCHLPHGQQLRHENTVELCTGCHRVPGDIYVHATHLDSNAVEVTCTDCHMGVDPTLTLASLQGESTDTSQTSDLLRDPAHEPTDHEMHTQIRSCNTCHQQMAETGIWSEIREVDDNLVIERDALQQQVTDLNEQLQSENQSQEENDTNYLQLILGVIVGVIVAGLVAFMLLPRARTEEEPPE